MPALNHTVFLKELVRRMKPHTIRESFNGKVGDPLFLYTGQRTKKCHKLVDTFCRMLMDIKIDCLERSVCVDGEFLDWGQITALARRDGFATPEDFFAFFRRKKDVFKGVIICFDMNRFKPTPYALQKYGAPDWTKMSKKELLTLPQRKWDADGFYREILLVNSRVKHDSGFNFFAVVGIKPNGDMEIAARMDDFWAFENWNAQFHMDCSMRGVFRFHSASFTHSRNDTALFKVGASVSSTFISCVRESEVVG